MQEVKENHVKAIILAAGSGTRLRPLTDDVPKCMVAVNGIRIIDYILSTINKVGIKNIKIIGGYKFDVLKHHLGNRVLELFENKDYANTNMVASFFNALNKQDFNHDIIISYSDIMYNTEILEKLVSCSDDISVVIDKSWESLWKIRMENPLDDAETLKLSPVGHIIEIGKKAKSIDEIQGQYIGLIKISAKALSKVIDFYNNMDKSKIYDGKSFNNMYMTSFLQTLIDSGFEIKPVFINRGWLEVDSIEDFEKYKKDGTYNFVEF